MDYSTTLQSKILMSDAKGESAETTATAEKADWHLVKLVLAGDENAFECIFERYKRLTAAIACRYFQRPEQIEEIIQISFAKVYFDLKGFRGEHDFSLARWIGRITTNCCLDALRNQKRKSENLLCELSDSEVEYLFAETPHSKDAESALVERDLAEKLLSQLTAEDRAILQMLDAEEMSVHEVSEITGWSNSKVKVRAHRARHALRKILRKFL